MASRGAKGDPELATRVLGAIDARIAEIDKELAAKFPDYAVFANPSPLTIKETQAQLGADEALVLFLDTQKTRHTREETFIWAVAKTDMRWVRADLGTNELTREVKALRCANTQRAYLLLVFYGRPMRQVKGPLSLSYLNSRPNPASYARAPADAVHSCMLRAPCSVHHERVGAQSHRGSTCPSRLAELKPCF
jgi:hypothetical protein